MGRRLYFFIVGVLVSYFGAAVAVYFQKGKLLSLCFYIAASMNWHCPAFPYCCSCSILLVGMVVRATSIQRKVMYSLQQYAAITIQSSD